MKQVVFCTTCKGRLPHLARTLPQNLGDNPNARFVVLEYGDQETGDYLSYAYPASIATGRLTVYSFLSAASFHMAHAKNMAHRLGILEGGDILVNLDADNFTGPVPREGSHGPLPDFADYVAEQFDGSQSGRSTEPVFLWAKMVKDGEGRLPRGISGRIAVSTSAFLKAGGYDEQFNTWAPDDKDFNLRLHRLGYEGREIPPQYLNAIRHTDKMRFREYIHARRGLDSGDAERSFEQVHESDNTVVNFGHFGNGIVYKNFDFSRVIELPNVPTRIFGIGWHKTATTSLHSALTILGYDSAHWKSAHWAKAIWTEMKSLGRSLTLEKHYALCDLPIPMLYKELDRAYPGSKFILTSRYADYWLRSAKHHWSPKHNKFRASWDTDPFSHKIHREMYGQTQFDESIFMARYRRHNEEVIEYFKNRPQDLLVLNMSAGDGWKELCEFLGNPVPAIPYPHTYQTEEI